MLAIKNKKALEIPIHIFIWIMLFSFPVLFSQADTPNIDMIFRRSWVPLIISAILFYINYLYLIDKWLGMKLILFIVINIVLILLFVWFDEIINALLRPQRDFSFNHSEGREHRLHPSQALIIYKIAISFIMPIVLSIALKVTQQWLRAESEKKEAVNKKLEFELQHLKYQLQPHFFFNSLNNVYSLIDSDAEKAKEAIHGLSKLMRYLLYETNTEKVKLVDEIDFMRRLIHLMNLRVSDKTKTTASLPNVPPHYQIAPLLFVPLIENAYKHGISATEPSSIFIELTFNSDRIYFLTENTNHPKSETDKSGSGIGLENLKKRLEILYPNKYVLKQEIEGNIFRSRLFIEFH